MNYVCSKFILVFLNSYSINTFTKVRDTKHEEGFKTISYEIKQYLIIKGFAVRIYIYRYLTLFC